METVSWATEFAMACESGGRCDQLVASLLGRLARRRPRVHLLINPVAEAFACEVVTALGGHPSASHDATEITAMIGCAEAVCLNLGMLTPERRRAIDVAVEALDGVPWLLDPVKVDLSEPRWSYARDLCGRGPLVIRGNRAEIVALAGSDADRLIMRDRSVVCEDEKIHEVLEQSLRRLHDQTGSIVVATGACDVMMDDQGVRWLDAPGSPMFDRTLSTGCAQGALMASLLSVAGGSDAVCAALRASRIALSEAADRSQGPASLRLNWVDELAKLADLSTPPTLEARKS